MIPSHQQVFVKTSNPVLLAGREGWGRTCWWTISLMSFRDERNYCDNQNYTASFLSQSPYYSVAVFWIIHFADVFLFFEDFWIKREINKNIKLSNISGEVSSHCINNPRLVNLSIWVRGLAVTQANYVYRTVKPSRRLCMILRGSQVNSSKSWH